MGEVKIQRRKLKKKSKRKNLTTSELNHYLASLHGELEEDTWDMYLDWHLAFSVSDVTPIFARLYLDSIPVVSRSESFFVEIPGEGIMIQVLAATNDLVEEAELKKQAHLPIPSLVPSHHSYTTTIPIKQQEVLHSFTTSDIVQPSWDSHLYSNGTCALLKWLLFNIAP